MDEPEKQAAELALKTFPGAKVRFSERGAGQADFDIQTKGHRLTVVVKSLSTSRLSDLEGKLASGTLTARRVSGQISSNPMVMVQLPRLGPKSIELARGFMGREAPDMGWCLFDVEGAHCLQIPPLGLVQRSNPRSRSESRAKPARNTLFSDLNRWMLKILLLREVSPQFWGGPRKAIQSVKDLETVAHVSQQTAYSFLRTFEAAGYVRETAEGISIVRRGELMLAWLHHDAAFHATRIPVRSILRAGQDLARILHHRGAVTRFAVTGFEACRLLGVLHAPIPQRVIFYDGNVKTAMDEWRLQPCDLRDADLFISKMSYPKSILRGCTVNENLPVVDILEASLSVFGQAPRGREQAEYIFQHVLKWEDCV